MLAAAPVAALVKVDAPQRAVPAMSIEEALLYGDASSAPGEFQGFGMMYPDYVTTDQIASGIISADKIRIRVR